MVSREERSVRLLPSAVSARVEERLARTSRRAPGQAVVLGFLGLVLVGTILLWLPVSKHGRGATAFIDALFTATSAACVVGLNVVDTGTHWSTFGQTVILLLMQVGGLGIMVGASLVGIAVSRRLGLRTSVMTAAATRTLGLADVRRVVIGVIVLSLSIEAVVAAALTLRFWAAYDFSFPAALWNGSFHAVSAFNNAGFSLFSDGLVPYVSDPWICLPIDAAIILGGLGFPVLFEIFKDRKRRRGRPRRANTLTPNTRMTLHATAGLLLVGTVAFLVIEWSNPATLGPLDVGSRLLASFTQGVVPRTAGFNTLDFSAMNPAAHLVTMALMFIGGASASTAGGIKVGTFMVALASVWAQVRGDDDTVLVRRTVSPGVVRQAYSLIFLFSAALFVGVVALVVLSDLQGDQAAFQATSALTTTGLSTVSIGRLPHPALVVLIIMMFLGRLGPVYVGAAFALRDRRRRYRYPEGIHHVG